MVEATLVTVHGFWSSPATWDRLRAVWRADDELEGLQVHGFGYPSPRKPRLPLSWTRVPDFADIAQMLAAEYTTKLDGVSNIAFVTHSQGGLILQRFLAWMISEGRGRELARIRTIVMLACPNAGSQYLASIRQVLGYGRHPQAASLEVLNKQVADTQRAVLARIVHASDVDDHQCQIPFHVYAAASDAIVPAASAQASFPGAGTLAGDHFTILDPAVPGNRTADIVKLHLLTDVTERPHVAAENAERSIPMKAVGKQPVKRCERSERESVAENSILASARSIGESRNRVALNIHTAIPLPDGAESNLSTDFPDYVKRDIDANLRGWIKGHSQDGGMVILAGDAASGKTRCLYEALYAEVPDWRMPRVETGAQINAMVRAQVDLSRTVLWLDELHNFFANDSLTADSVRQLIAGHRFGPVLLAGTIRDEELVKLRDQPEPEDKPGTTGQHAREIKRMLARWSKHNGPSQRALLFHVDNRFSPEEVARAQTVADRDPRLRTALRDAESRRVTATLAGAPELIDRWTLDTGNRYGQAIITAAVTARRCGHPEPVPAAVLESLALAQLAVAAATPPVRDWLQGAIQWAESPVEGNIAALRPVVTAPGVIDGHKVSDILLQYSYEQACSEVQPLLDDDRTWTLLRDKAASPACAGIGRAAYAAGRTEMAKEFWKQAAQAGNVSAMIMLGHLYRVQGNMAEAERWYQQAINHGDITAMMSLGYLLRSDGQLIESMSWIRQAADRGNADAMVIVGLELQATGEVEKVKEAEDWYKRAAELDNAIAMANLGYLFRKRGDKAEAERWNRMGAVLGQPGAMSNLAELLRERGKLDEALGWFRKAADRAMAAVEERPSYYDPWPGECGDLGVSNAVLGLAELLVGQGESGEGEVWFRKIAELGDDRAAAALADLHEKRGEMHESSEWCQKAASLAHDNLSRNKSSLLAAYGDSVIRRHVRIIQSYADHLAAQGETEAANYWYQLASSHLGPDST